MRFFLVLGGLAFFVLGSLQSRGFDNKPLCFKGVKAQSTYFMVLEIDDNNNIYGSLSIGTSAADAKTANFWGYLDAENGMKITYVSGIYEEWKVSPDGKFIENPKSGLKLNTVKCE